MASEKTCFKCSAIKPLSEFYPHPQMGDGHLNKCKECTKRDVRENYAANAEYYKEYDVARAKTPERKAWAADALRRLRQKWPDKDRARGAVSKSLRSGKLQALPCWVCGGEAEAHHPSYSMPLDVIWLCRQHHREAHDLLKSA